MTCQTVLTQIRPLLKEHSDQDQPCLQLTHEVKSFTVCILDKFACFLLSADFFPKYSFQKFFQEYHQSVKHVGSRSGLTFWLNLISVQILMKEIFENINFKDKNQQKTTSYAQLLNMPIFQEQQPNTSETLEMH